MRDIASTFSEEVDKSFQRLTRINKKPAFTVKYLMGLVTMLLNRHNSKALLLFQRNNRHVWVRAALLQPNNAAKLCQTTQL